MRLIYITMTLFFCLNNTSYAAADHMVTGVVKYADNTFPEDLTWKAYIINDPSNPNRINDKISDVGPGARYHHDTGIFEIQMDEFYYNWSVGDTMRIDFKDTHLNSVSMTGVITAGTQDNFGVVIMPTGKAKLTLKHYQASWGRIEPKDGEYAHNIGDVVQIKAYPAKGYRFKYWSENPNVADYYAAFTTVTMNGDQKIDCVFSKMSFSLTTVSQPVAGGIIQVLTEPDHDDGKFNTAKVVDLLATPNPGYRFVEWQGDVSSVLTAATTIEMYEDETVTAIFASDGGNRTLNISVNPDTAGTTIPEPGAWEYAPGTVVDISASAAAGYVFTNWSGVVEEPDSASTTVTMDSSKSIVANFALARNVVIATAPAGLRIVVDDSVYTAPHEFVWADSSIHTIAIDMATQNGGAGVRYLYQNWSDGGAQSHQIVADSLTALYTANFNTQYYLTTAVTPVNGGTITPAAPGAWFSSGAQVSVSAAANTALNYVFAEWNGALAGTINPGTVVMDAPKTVTAVFNIPQYTLTMVADPVAGGTMNPAAGSHVYANKTQVQLSAAPAAGYRFKSWSGNVNDSTNATTFITMVRNETVRAKFELLQSTLTIAVNPAGTGITSPAAGVHTFTTGETVTVIAVPMPGYRFVSWSGEVANPANDTTSIVLNSNKLIIANFASNTYTLTLAVNPVGTGITSPAAGVHTCNAGATVNVIAVPIPGHRFVSWSGDVANPANDTTSIVMNGNKSITANFEADTYTLTLAVSPANSGTIAPVAGTYTYPAGQVVQIAATPATGYQFVSWTGDVAQPNSATTTVIINQHKSVTANFIRVGGFRITTNPEGLRIIVDGTACQSPIDFNWTSGSVHTIGIDSTTQYSGAGTRHSFQSWSDGGEQTHQITVNGVTVYTAVFTTQYYLTTANNPENGGAMTPAPPGNWYDKNSSVAIHAVPDTANGYRFLGWAGSLSGITNPTSVLMDAPRTITARYGRLFSVILNTQPEGLSVSVDGTKYSTPSSFNWEHNSVHSIAVDTLKSGGANTRYAFKKWNDNKPRQHNVTIISDSVFTAQYTTQYYLTTAVTPENSGTVIPAAPGAWIDKDSTVQVQAIANNQAGYAFSGWVGALTGNVNPASLLMDAPKSLMAQFYSSDVAAPYLAWIYPVDSASYIPANTDIKFKVMDNGSGINLASLILTVNSAILVNNGIDQTGGRVSITPSGKGCTVNYDPAGDFAAGSEVVINIQCEDLSLPANKMNLTTLFQTGAASTNITCTDTLGTEGGLVFDDSTGISMYIPAQALSDTTILTIGTIDQYPALPADKRGLALAMYFGPSGLQFADSVTITIPYNQAILDSAGVSNPMQLKVYYYSVTTNSWITLKVIDANALNIYVKVKEFCYLVYGKKFITLSKPMKPVGPASLVMNTLYGYETSRVQSTLGHAIEYRFDWGDGQKSSWSGDVTGAHKWVEEGNYGIVAFARSKVDTTMDSYSDTLYVTVSEFSAIDESNALPTAFKVEQNYPNPFNPETTIKYQAPKNTHIRMNIYSINGQKIRTLVNEEKQAGYYTVVWDGKNDGGMNVASGIYIMQIRAGEYVNVIKMSLLK